MSQNSSAPPQHDHMAGFMMGGLFGAGGALVGYLVGYLLLMIAGQSVIIVAVANLTNNPLVGRTVLSQYAGATIWPFLLALFGAVFGLVFGYLRYR